MEESIGERTEAEGREGEEAEKQWFFPLSIFDTSLLPLVGEEALLPYYQIDRRVLYRRSTLPSLFLHRFRPLPSLSAPVAPFEASRTMQ
jgi:hypothetical protein